MSMTFQPLDEYRNALRGFDWYYDYSDDYTYWAKAKQQHDILRDQARLSDDHKQVWDEVLAERREKQLKTAN